MCKHHPVIAASLLALLSVSLTSPSAIAQAPNVILIVADDAGYADFGFMDGLSGETSQIPTPNLDALANRGVTFSRAYVHSNCQPTRAALVTGGYQYRIGNEVVGNNYYQDSQGFAPQGVPEGVPGATTTIWERMKSQGYATAAVGKWHLGQTSAYTDLSGNSIPGNRPQNQGVDEFFGMWHGSRDYNVGTETNQTQRLRKTLVDSMGNVTDTNEESTHAGEYFTNTLGDYAVDFIDRHHNDANPFFLYQSFSAPHTPLQNSPDFNDPALSDLSGTRKTYGSMMYTMDKEIGRIIERLDDPNGDGNMSDSIADNTMIMFINDNGGADAGSSSPNGADNGNLRQGKGTPWEGGIRVPMILAGAGVTNTAAENTVYNKPVHGFDILPTAFAASGGTFGPGDTGIDGVNLLPYVQGTTTGNPHDVIIYRQRSQFSVVKDDWKLVWSGNTPSANHNLYNLATNIGETNNVAGANPAKVAELQRDLTDHEVNFDKQRYEILNQTSEATINIFDHFTFKPNASTSGVESIIIEGATGNGDFEATTGSGTGAHWYTETPNWYNASGSDGINFTNDSQTGGSGQSNSRAGMPFQNRQQVNDTGYTVTAAGETFDLSYDFGRGGGGWNGDESMRLFLFTAIDTVNGALTSGEITEVVSDVYNFPASPQWTSYTSDNFYTTTVADIGKTFYLGMEHNNPGGADVFPRIDIVELTVTTPGSGSSITDWSASGAWFEGGTSNVETLLNADAFAGAVLEFPTTNTFSYTSNNDMIRNTGLEFMLNKIVLSGAFNGAQNQSATIQGKALLFTKDLDGVGPKIAVDATNSGSPEFNYSIDLDVIMYHDLTITGDGDTQVTINGEISDYFTPRNLIKSGTSTAILTASNTYEGDTTVEAGTLSITNAFLADAADVYLTSDAIFDLDFVGSDTIDSLFIDDIAQVTGTWGSLASTATNKSALFIGTGLLSVSTVAVASGDFDGDGDVDGADFLKWQREDQTPAGLTAWENNFGNTSLAAASATTVPEPTTCVLLGIAIGLTGLARHEEEKCGT